MENYAVFTVAGRCFLSPPPIVEITAYFFKRFVPPRMKCV